VSVNPRRLLAAAVIPGAIAVAMLAIPGAAGASTGTAEISPAQAGYTATGAQFKSVHAAVWLRQTAQYISEVHGFGHSIQLWSSGLVVTLGVRTQFFNSYGTYATIYDRSTHTVIASNPNSVFCGVDDDCNPGTGDFTANTGYPITLQVDYNPTTGLLSMAEYDEGEGFSFTASYTVPGQSFSEARIGTDFGSSPWDGSYSYHPPAKSVKVAAYSNVTLTSDSGHTATLWSWWVHHKLLANTGQQSGSDWVAVPTDLSSGGGSFQTLFVPQSGQGPNQPVMP
jgi:hypothetical protein